jgi:hypothetical protein
MTSALGIGVGTGATFTNPSVIDDVFSLQPTFGGCR